MCFFIQIILALWFSSGGVLGRYAQQKLAEEDLWKGPFGRVKEGLRSGIAICERWVAACQTLTSQFWKRYSPHPWTGDTYVPENLTNLATRFEEVRWHFMRTYSWVYISMSISHLKLLVLCEMLN